MKFLLAFLFSLPIVALALECPEGTTAQKSDAGKSLLHSWCEKDGQRQGPYEVFSLEKGRLITAEYKDDKLNGAFTRSYAEGRLAAQGEYTAGEMSGHWRRIYSSGKIKDEGDWLHDKPQGHWKKFDSAGVLAWEGDYKDGEIVIEKSFNKTDARIPDYSFFWYLGQTNANAQGEKNSYGPFYNDQLSDEKSANLGFGWRTLIIKNIDFNLLADISSFRFEYESKQTVVSLAAKFDLLGYWLFPFSVGVLKGVQAWDSNDKYDYGGIEISYRFKNKYFLGFNRIFLRHEEVDRNKEKYKTWFGSLPRSDLGEDTLAISGAF